MQPTHYGDATHVGRVREHNEDSHFADPELGLWIVADGMGGHRCGEVASQIAVDFIREEVGKGSALRAAVERAHEVVLLAAGQGLGHPGMGSTVVALKLDGPDYELSWVGDSRAYLWDEGVLVQLTRDHSLVQQLVDAGQLTEEEALLHPNRNVVTQALGAADLDQVEVEEARGTLHQGQQILLCSDGLTGEVSEAEIREILAGEADAQGAVERLIDRTLEHGASDNVTAILVCAPADAPEKPIPDTIPIDVEALARNAGGGDPD